MSIKIYNGFRFVEPNILKIKKALHIFRLQIIEATKIEYHRMVGELCARIHDYRSLGEPLPFDDGSPVGLIACREIGLAANDQNNKDVDFDFKVGVYPVDQKTTLGIYFSGRELFGELIRNESWYIEYHYQTIEEKPDNIAAKEWKKRNKHWGQAFKETCRFDQAGFIMDLTYGTPFILIEEIIKHMPGLSSRLNRISFDKLIEEIATDETKSIGWLRSKKGKVERAKIKKKIKKKIKTNLEINDIFGGDDDPSRNSKKESAAIPVQI